MRAAHTAKIGNGDLTSRFNFGDKWYITHVWALSLNENLKINISDRHNFKCIMTGLKDAEYTYGLGLEFKM